MLVTFTEMENGRGRGQFQKYCFRHISFQILIRHVIAGF